VVQAAHGTEKDENSRLDRLMRAIDKGKLVLVLEDVEPLLEELARAGTASALDQVEISDADITSQANDEAIAYAKDRAAEIVGMRYDEDDELVENPNAEWRIDDATRELLRADVSRAEEEGWSNDRLASAIESNYAFSEDRAAVIARTESAFADVAGNLAAWDASGLVSGKQWIVSADACDECQPLDGVVVALDEDFPDGGGDGPPLHPNCECDVVPVLEDDDG
jgi:SPP1 gp7 family putative phage head morphogenesis protein